MKKKKKISYSIERAILSDTLPYETPIIFSNRHLYEFLVKYEVKFDPTNQKIVWKKHTNDSVLSCLIALLFDGEVDTSNSFVKISNKRERKIPFDYKITHKQNDFRHLSVPHPKSQLELVSFYEEYKELILYYSKQSSFSIRKPHGIAKYVYINDVSFKKNRGNEDDFIEEDSKEYKSLKTFFKYEKYSNIYKFYEDYVYHRAEKKYDKMFKFDISKCFDSIYTHSISWALFGKQFIKGHLDKEQKGKSFTSRFDKFMQNVNYGETNGIIIGPEFSRVFAELILQQIDKKIEGLLNHEKYVHNRDYEIFRYVDDFFVFYNDDIVKDLILDSYKIELKEYKMALNGEKTILYEKPLITEITIAKNKIVNLFKDAIKFKIRKDSEREDKEQLDGQPEGLDTVPDKKIKISDVDLRCSSNKLITEFKTILVDSNVSYKDVMNYTLAILKKRLEKNISKYHKYKIQIDKKKINGILTGEELKKITKQESNFTNYITETLDFVFFLYGVSPKVNSTIKLGGILSIIVETFKKKYKVSKDDGQYELINQFSDLNKEVVFKKISDEITLVLEKNKMNKHVQIETLYLLIILKELGREYRLSNHQIEKYFGLRELYDQDGKSYSPNRFEFGIEVNYFVLTVLLYYIGNINQYRGLKVVIQNEIIRRIKGIKKDERTKHTELVLLLFDLLSCPYLEGNNQFFKRLLLVNFGVPKEKHDQFLTFVIGQGNWFTKWSSFNLVKELNAKSSLEPYS